MTDFEPQYPQGRSAGYQQQGYQQQGYGPPPYGPPPIRSTNTMAVLAIVFAFVFAPLGIVFGAMARNQIRQTGEDGAGLALAGIVIGVILTVLIVVYLVLAILLINAGLDDLFENLPDQQ